jgi:hypothetical protein
MRLQHSLITSEFLKVNVRGANAVTRQCNNVELTKVNLPAPLDVYASGISEADSVVVTGITKGEPCEPYKQRASGGIKSQGFPTTRSILYFYVLNT